MKLGKTPATYDKRDFLFAEFERPSAALAQAPVGFGHYHVYPYSFDAWKMLGNDDYGDCVWAGAAHEHMMLNKMNAVNVTFTDKSVLGDYSAVTGFNINDPDTDQGTNMRDGMNYRRKVGILDGSAKRHTIAAYVALEAGNWEQHLEALYLFDCVAVGIEFPQSAMDQFDQGMPWTYIPTSPIVGGHYIPIVGRPYTNYLSLVTWGTYKRMSKRFFQHYNDESYAFVTAESLSKLTAKTPEGFSLSDLQAAVGSI